MRCFVWCMFLALSAGISGCQGESEADRLERLVPGALNTTKINGKVLVDGEPVKDIWVTLHPVDPKVPLRPRGQTDANGNFKLTTYTGGDGAPEGEYNVTIAWLTYSSRDKDWGGADKLKDQYSDPKTTSLHLTVKDTPMELPTFELKLAGVTGNAAPVAKPLSRKRER